VVVVRARSGGSARNIEIVATRLDANAVLVGTQHDINAGW